MSDPSKIRRRHRHRRHWRLRNQAAPSKPSGQDFLMRAIVHFLERVLKRTAATRSSAPIA